SVSPSGASELSVEITTEIMGSVMPERTKANKRTAWMGSEQKLFARFLFFICSHTHCSIATCAPRKQDIPRLRPPSLRPCRKALSMARAAVAEAHAQTIRDVS